MLTEAFPQYIGFSQNPSFFLGGDNVLGGYVLSGGTSANQPATLSTI